MNSATLMFEQTKLVNVRAESVQLEAPLVGYRLRFHLELQFLSPPDPDLTEIRLPGEAYVTKSGASTSPKFVGPLHLDKFGMVFPPSSPGATLTEYATIELPALGLEALEEIREGDGLTFQLQFHPVLIWDSRPVALPYAQVELEVNQSRWLTLLEQVRYRRTLLLELPIPDAAARPDLAAALGHFEHAQMHFLRGHYRDAIARCRDAIDALTHSLGDRSLLEALVPKDLPDLPKTDRLRLVRRSVFRLTHLAHHADSLASSTKWAREDARFLIAMTAAVLLVPWEDS